jgi:hypothetical protein
MVRAARCRAKKSRIPFNISYADIIIPDKCPYLSIPIILPNYVLGSCGPSSRNAPSLDRIVPEKGYVVGNVEVISHLANTMKQDASIEQLQQFALSILNKYPDPSTNETID